MTLTQDLLTENRYWTFWSGDWSIRVNVLWNGKTKWKKVQDKVIAKMIKDYPDKLPTILEAGYERQVCLQNPDITFA